jgi:predicted TIM-barrel fold metal-dependent hydrolase
MKRRQFFGAAAGAVGAALAARAFPTMELPVALRESPGTPPAGTDSFYLDAHTHPRSQALIDFRASRARGPETPVDGAELVRRMDADGIRRAFVLSTAYQMASDVNAHAVDEEEERRRLSGENDYTAAQCARFPNRLIPFLSVNPKRSYAVAEIDRCIDQHQMRGLKLHLWNSMVDTRQAESLNQLRRVVSHAAERGLPVLAHIFVGAVTDYGPDDTERFVREIVEPLPSLKICFAHLAGAGRFLPVIQRCFERLIDLCGPDSRTATRVWVDMAAIFPTTPSEQEKLLALLPRWGLDRVLWGSDSLPNAVSQSRAACPLDDAAWAVIERQRGERFVA